MEQTLRAMENLRTVLQESEFTFPDVVQSRISACLPKGACVEIGMVAKKW